jgi:hypothetical protein
MTQTDTPPAPTPAPPRRGWLRRWWWRLALILLAVGLLLVAALPTLLSSGPVMAYVLSSVNRTIPGTIAVNDVSLGWFSGMRVQGVSLRDPQGQVVASIKDIDARDASLTRMLSSYTRPGTIRIVEPVLDLVVYDDDTTNLSRALAATKPAPDPTRPRQDKPASKPGDGPTFGDVSTRIEIIDARVSLVAPDIERVDLHARELSMNVSSLHEQTLKLDATLRQGGEEGVIAATVRLTELLDPSMHVKADKAHVEADVTIRSLPLAPLDRLTNQQGRLVALWGTRLDVTLKADCPLGRMKADLQAASEHLQANLSLGMADDIMTVKPGSRIALTVTPTAYAALTAPPQGEGPAPQLLESFDVVVLINQLTAAHRDGEVRLDAAAIDAQIAVGDLRIDAGGAIGTLALRQTRLEARSPRLADKLTLQLSSRAEQIASAGARGGAVTLQTDVTNLIKPDGSFNDLPSLLIEGMIGELPMALIDELGQLDGLALAAVGPILSATIHGNIAPDAEGQWAGDIQFTAAAEHLDVNLAGGISSNVFTASPGSRVRLVVQPALAARFLDTGESDALALASPTTVTVAIDQLAAPLQAFALDKVTAGATVAVDRLALAGDPRFTDTALRDVTVTLSPVALDQPIPLSLRGELVRRGRTSPFVGDAVATGFVTDGATPAAKATVVLNDLPTELIDTLGEQEGKLLALIGQVIERAEVVADVVLGESPRYDAVAKLTSASITSDLAATYTPAGITVRRGSWVGLVITPEAFAAYQKLTAAQTDGPPAQPLVLGESLRLRAELHEAVVALKPDAGFDPAGVRLDAHLTSPGFTIRQGPQAQPYTLRDLDVTVKTANLRDRLDLVAKAVMPGADKASTLTSSTTLTHLFDDAGAFDMDTLTIATDTAGQISVALLDVLTQSQGQLIAALGDTAHANVKGNFPGNLDIALKSPTADVSLSPILTRERVAGLRQPGVATLVVTQDLVRMLTPYFPIVGDVTAGDQPIKLTLSEKLDVPLREFNIEDLLVSGRLELGTLEINRRGNVLGLVDNIKSSIEAIARRDFGRLALAGGDRPSYPVTFSPMDFNLAKGQMNTREFWLTSPDLAMGFQGGVNLTNNRLDLTMGLPGAMLATFGSDMRKFVEMAGVYEVGIRGTSARWNPQTDRLLKQLTESGLKQAASALGDRVGGIDLGGIVGAVTGSPKASSQLTWNPPVQVQQFIQSRQQPEQPQPAQPLTPEERQQRREQRQQGQQGQQQQQQPAQPRSPLDLLLEQVAPREPATQPPPQQPEQRQPVVSEEERARRREERQRQREAERQQ